MGFHTLKIFSLLLATVVSLVAGPVSPTLAEEPRQEVKIGVLAFRSPESTLEQWAPTADYLSQAIPEYRFVMIPMHYPQMAEAFANDAIDFVLTNTAHYVALEHEYGISRIATLVKDLDGVPAKSFGGIIFTRNDREDIAYLEDLKGKSFMAVGENSLGGFLVAWEQLQLAGIDPYRDFVQLQFHGLPQDGIVRSVLEGKVDAGTVRTGVMEQMIKEGKLASGSIKLLNTKKRPGFPYVLSTELYPEWPFARLAETRDEIAEKVVVALLSIKRDDPAAITGRYDRWTTPLDYNDVHNLFKKLQAGPYADFGSFTPLDVIRKHAFELVFLIVIFAALVIVTMRMIWLNKSLKTALSEVKTLQGFLPICSTCKKIRDDSGYWKRIETYIKQHSEAEFSHSICPECSQKLIDQYDEEQQRIIGTDSTIENGARPEGAINPAQRRDRQP